MPNQRLDKNFEQLIASGGDNRLVLGQSGLNRYGSGPRAHDRIQFGSCTCSSPSPRAIDAASQMHTKLMSHPNPAKMASQQFQLVRDQLRNHLALPANVDIALTPSGTDVEMLALALVASKTDRPIVNLVVGPSEVGSGTCLAAGAHYFDSVTPAGNSVNVQQAVNEGLASRVTVEHVDVRDAFGRQLSAAEIDLAVTEMVIDAVSSGAHVIVHLVAHSKTAIHAPSLDAIGSIKATLKDDVTIMVDAAQGRLQNDAYKTVLKNDCLVSFTGSKFFSGPPFCGALFVPQSMRPGSGDGSCLPNGFSEYFNSDSLPKSWQRWRSQCSDWTNFGLLLRWTAAIEEMATFFQLDPEIREVVFFTFANEVINSILSSSQCTGVPTHVDPTKRLPDISSYCSVFAFEVASSDNGTLAKNQLKEIHQQLNTNPRFGYLIGQPVQIGQHRSVLRIAVGAPLIIDVITDVSLGGTLDQRMAWLRHNIRSCFKAIDSLVLGSEQFASTYTENAST